MNRRPVDTDLKIRMSPSLALLTIANIIPKQHTVLIENENIEAINYNDIADLVGITITVDTMPRAVLIAKKFRSLGVKVVAGGIHITANPNDTQKYFDAICIGMAETTWPQIIEDIKINKLKPIYISNADQEHIKISSPLYEHASKNQYLYSNIVSTSRGCPFQCDFCYNSCENYRSLYINRPIPDVLKDIRKINKKHIMFIDDNFIGNPSWTIKFLHSLLPLHLKWNAAVSANIVDMPQLLDLMKDSGCQSLFIGFESLNALSISDVHKKQNNIKKYEKLVHELHRRGIMINASFVFGLDGDDKTTFRSTLDWIIKHKIETVTSHILTPYPGTALYQKLLLEGRITDFNLSHYNTAHVVFKPKSMTKEELYQGYLWIYKELYSLPNIMKRFPNHKSQRMAYLSFNLFYRKFGKLTDKLCKLLSYSQIGKLAEFAAYRINDPK